MIKKIKIQNLLSLDLRYLSKLRKIYIFLVFVFFYSLFSAVFGTGESPEVIEEIRKSLHIKFEKATNKSTFAKQVGISEDPLKKFLGIKEGNLRANSINTIIEGFKREFYSEYETILKSLSSARLIDPVLSSKTESIKAYPCLDIASLPFHSSYPDTYSLLMVNSSLIPYATQTDWDQHPTFKDLGLRFLRPSLATDRDISFAVTEQEIQEQKHWILKDEKTILIPNEGEKTYYILQLFKKREELRSVALLKTLTERRIGPYNGFDFQAALIIFPFSTHKAMVYGLGKWGSLLNPDCIIPQWGLRLVTSGQICNPDQIKEFHAAHYRISNPSSTRKKVAVPQPIEVYGLEVGSEELKTITLLPNKSVKTHHVIEGTDHLKFTVNSSDQATSEQTLQSLSKIAMYFFTLTNDLNFHIHSRMREFIDDEIKESDTIAALNQQLQRLLKIPEGKELIFVHHTLWKEMKSKKLQFGESKAHSIFDVFVQLAPESSFPETIQVWKPRLKFPREFVVRQIFYSLPLEYNGNFYRFDRNHWYQVDASRFEGIKRILRQVKKPSVSLHLPDYSLEDTNRSTEEKKADYKEAKYNLRAVQEINKKDGWGAILLDRINVSLGDAGNKFEFADILVNHNNIFYIVHVKRDGASALSHHREQVERSADFLATELTKKNADTLFLQGIINGLYERKGLPIKKEKAQGSRITKGHVFLDYYTSRPQDFFSNLAPIALINIHFSNFLQGVWSFVDVNFFRNYPSELVSALDALLDCSSHAYPSSTEINEFLEAVKQGINARQLLFPKGIIKKSDLEKIRIVLAVIDDHSVEATLKDTKVNPHRIIFKNQDLWGLDRTRTVVEKTGLGFDLMVINESLTGAWDAFGPIIKKEKKENFISKSGDEPELSFGLYVPKAEPFRDPAQSFKKDLKVMFQSTNVHAVRLDVDAIQKLQYFWVHNQTTIVYGYFTCPTIGDGDCFFHAAFTEPGDFSQAVQSKAAQMREELCDAVQNGQHIDDFRNLLYEHYIEILADDENTPYVPEDIRQFMKEKNQYASMFNSMQHFGISLEGIQNVEAKFPVDRVKALILENHVKEYAERLRTVGGPETYIPFREGMRCPADLIAAIGKRKINIFTFNAENQRLHFHKTAGTEGQIINVLHAGKHFTRLYLPVEGDASFHQCEQIWTNYSS